MFWRVARGRSCAVVFGLCSVPFLQLIVVVVLLLEFRKELYECCCLLCLSPYALCVIFPFLSGPVLCVSGSFWSFFGYQLDAFDGCCLVWGAHLPQGVAFVFLALFVFLCFGLFRSGFVCPVLLRHGWYPIFPVCLCCPVLVGMYMLAMCIGSLEFLCV